MHNTCVDSNRSGSWELNKDPVMALTICYLP